MKETHSFQALRQALDDFKLADWQDDSRRRSLLHVMRTAFITLRDWDNPTPAAIARDWENMRCGDYDRYTPADRWGSCRPTVDPTDPAWKFKSE